MANRTYEVRTIYKSIEKVAEFRVYYLEDQAVPENAQNYAQQIADDFHGRLEIFATGQWPSEVIAYGVEVSAIEDPPFGPANYVRGGFRRSLGAQTAPVPDSVTILYNLSGQRIDATTAVSTLKISGVAASDVDCNAVNDTRLTQLRNGFLLYAPLEIVIGGTTAPMIIQSAPNGVPENVIVQDVAVNPLLGSMIDRIGNRSAGMPSRCTPPQTCPV